jgi:hypothetical protein
MYCPFCGSEYTQKLNYCKRCGENLNPGVPVVEPQAPRRWVALLFVALTLFGLGGLIVLFSAHYQMAKWGLRGDDLFMPFMAGLLFMGGVSGFLIYLLARAIGSLQQTRQVVFVERPALIENRSAPPALPNEAAQPAAARSSVTEHTTRQFGAVVRESTSRE